MSDPLDYRGYPVKPRQLSDEAWFYEEPRGITVVVSHGLVPRVAIIPWRKVVAAVNHHFNAKRKAVRR